MPKASASPSSTPALPASYEDAMQELETLVRSLESGEMPLEQLLSGYQRGAQLLHLLQVQRPHARPAKKAPTISAPNPRALMAPPL